MERQSIMGHYLENGFAVIPGLLELNELAEWRTLAEKAFRDKRVIAKGLSVNDYHMSKASST